MQKHSKTKKHHRYHPVYTSIHLGATALTALSMFGLAEVTRFETAYHMATQEDINKISIEKAEAHKKTVRMAVNYTDGLRPITISGA